MLSERLQEAVFPDDDRSSKADPRIVELSRAHLKKHELPIDTSRTALPDVDIKMSSLVGNDIEEHFWKLGAVLGLEYAKLVDSYLDKIDPTRISNEHFKWELNTPGWTQY